MIKALLSIIGYIGVVFSILATLAAVVSVPMEFGLLQTGISGFVGSIILLAFVRVIDLLESIDFKLDVRLETPKQSDARPYTGKTFVQSTSDTTEANHPVQNDDYGVQKEFIKNHKGIPIYREKGTKTFHVGSSTFGGILAAEKYIDTLSNDEKN